MTTNIDKMKVTVDENTLQNIKTEYGSIIMNLNLGTFSFRLVRDDDTKKLFIVAVVGKLIRKEILGLTNQEYTIRRHMTRMIDWVAEDSSYQGQFDPKVGPINFNEVESFA